MVAERLVLLRVEHLEHRRRGIAAEVGAHLVELVDQQHGVHRLGVANRTDDAPGHRADVRAPVTADLRLVAHAADRQPRELALERAGDRLAERGLADAGRADETEDLPRRVAAQLRDGEELDDPRLHLLEVEVVRVEHRACTRQVEVVLGRRRPGKRRDPVEIRADHAVLGCGRRQPLEPAELAERRLPGLLRQVERFDARPQLLELRLLGVALAELRLDRLQLLAQEELSLALVELRLHLRLDLRPELEHLELPVEDHRHLAQALLDVDELEQLLLLLRLQPERRRDERCKRARVVDVRGGELKLFGEVRDERDDAAEEGLHVPRERFELFRLLDVVGKLDELADEIRVVGDATRDADTPEALDEDAQRPVGDANHLVDDRRGADLVEIVPPGRLRVGIADRDEREQTVASDDVVDQLDRPFLSDRERSHRLREDDRLLQREDRQRSSGARVRAPRPAAAPPA